MKQQSSFFFLLLLSISLVGCDAQRTRRSGGQTQEAGQTGLEGNGASQNDSGNNDTNAVTGWEHCSGQFMESSANLGTLEYCQNSLQAHRFRVKTDKTFSTVGQRLCIIPMDQKGTSPDLDYDRYLVKGLSLWGTPGNNHTDRPYCLDAQAGSQYEVEFQLTTANRPHYLLAIAEQIMPAFLYCMDLEEIYQSNGYSDYLAKAMEDSACQAFKTQHSSSSVVLMLYTQS